jgi:hypothetical protein
MLLVEGAEVPALEELLLSDPQADRASAPATTTPPSAVNRVPFFTGRSPLGSSAGDPSSFLPGPRR